ncbi:MAG: acyl-CoA thioesterase [Alphaproteobacteria bacterium]
MASAVEQLTAIVDLEPLEHNLFRGRSPQVGWQRVFGGQVIAQALVAGSRTVDPERRVHSLHGYFMRPGDPAVPIIYEVDRIRDGKSFTTRRVVAIQHGEAIFSMSASFQIAEDGLSHQIAMPDVPDPDDLVPEAEVEPVQNVWFRASEPLPDDRGVHECVLAYASDMTLLDTALFAHGKSVFSRDLQVASLDHALWFHHPVKADEWLLYAADSPSSSGARGFTRGSVFSRDGKLVASSAQEGLIRPRNSPK